MPIPPGSFRESLDSLDSEDRAAFVAAVYEARGWTVERISHEGEDVVVTPPNGDESRRVPASVDASTLHEQVTYAIDDEAQIRLCRRFFGRPPAAFTAADEDDSVGDTDVDTPPAATKRATADDTARSPPERRTEEKPSVTGRNPSDASPRAAVSDGAADGGLTESTDGDDARPSVPVRLVVGLVAVAIVGAAVVAGAGVTSPEGAGVTSPGEGANATTTPGAAIKGSAAAARSDEAPPGIDENGVADASALADAHAEALAERSYRIRIVHREYADGELQGVAVEQVAVAETDHYHSRVQTLGSPEYQTRHVASVSAYANGTVRYVRPVDGRDTLRNATFRLFMVSDTSTPNRYVDRTHRYVQWFLDVKESWVVGAGERDGTAFVAVAIDGDPWRGASGMTGRAVVDEDGLVRVIRREYTPQDDPAVRVETTIRIVPGPVSVTRPAWVESANETTPTPDGAEALRPGHGQEGWPA